MMTACWDSYITACHVKQDEVSYINGMKKNSTTTFLNNENQICYFQDFGLRVGNMGGFYYQPWSYVYSLNIWVSCEDSSSVPQYCAKTEKMAKQVLLAKEEMECEEKGGEFEGGVYRFKMPNDSIEYCVAGRCDVCHSQWYKKFVENWKDSVCCETRGKEPNTNNGTCISPPPFDSTKIGVKHSNITAFPGCSKADAGTNNNFCYRSSSSSVSSSSVASSSSNISSSSISSSSAESSSSNDSSSSEDSSSSGDSSSSEESSSSNDSSSSEEPYSSSEEQEDANCHPNSSEAQATLHNAEAKCWSMQMESGYQLDDNGCLTGECYGGIYSSDDDDGLSSTSEWESSSSEERCIDISLLKESGDEEEDQSTYVGKEKYTSRTISYEEVTPSSGFFDALGRMYKTIKSKIKYFMGIDTKVKKTVEVGEELEVRKINEVFDGKNVTSYRKISEDRKIDIDSIVFEDGLYSVMEINNNLNYVRFRNEMGEELYSIYNDENMRIKSFYIGLHDEYIYDSEGRQKPFILNINGDTAYLNIDFFSALNNYEASNEDEENRALAKNNNTAENDELKEKDRLAHNNKCLGLVQKKDMPYTQCPRYKKNQIPYKNKRKFYPSNYEYILKAKEKGIETDQVEGPSYAETLADLGKTGSSKFKCVCGKDGKYYHKLEYWRNTNIYVYKSLWSYDNKSKKWNETCASKDDMQNSYNHEIKHYIRAQNVYNRYRKLYMYEETNDTKINNFTTEERCTEEGEKGMQIFMREFETWSNDEYMHAHKSAPRPSDNRETATCPN